MSNTVTLHQRDNHVYDGVADGAVTPGELLERTGTDSDGNPQFAAHSTAAGAAKARFAKEYSHTGMSIDDDYSDGDHMEYRDGIPGDRFNAFLAAGENVSEGDKLVSAGNGALQAVTGDGTDAAVIVAEAYEGLDNSGGADPVRIEVEV